MPICLYTRVGKSRFPVVHMEKDNKYALAGVAQWIECQPANQRVTGSQFGAHVWVAGWVPVGSK